MALFQQEKSGKRAIVLQIVSFLLYVLALALTITAAGLFGSAQSRLNSELARLGVEEEYCILFFKEDNTNPSEANCGYAIAGEVLAAVGLGILIVVGIVKLAAGFMKNNIFLVIEIILLVITSIFAVTAAIVICAGWGVACDTINDALKSLNSDLTCNRDFYEKFTGAAACGALACIIIGVSVVMYIITAVTSRRE